MKYIFDMFKEIRIIFWNHKLIFCASKNNAIKQQITAPSRNILRKALFCSWIEMAMTLFVYMHTSLLLLMIYATLMAHCYVCVCMCAHVCKNSKKSSITHSFLKTIFFLTWKGDFLSLLYFEAHAGAIKRPFCFQAFKATFIFPCLPCFLLFSKVLLLVCKRKRLCCY